MDKLTSLFRIAFAALLVTATVVRAQDRAEIERALESSVTEFAATDRPAREVLEGIARSYNIPLVMEPEVDGNVTFRIFGARLRNVLDAVCAPHGWNYEIAPEGYLVVRKYVTRVYSVDYLQITQNGSSSASVSLSGGGNNSGLNVGQNGQTQQTVTTANGVNGQNGVGGSGSGSSTISLTSSNDADFWTRFEGDVKQLLNDGEGLVINRFAGIVQLRATLRTHAQMEIYIRRVMQRVRRSAKITVRVVRVDLKDVKQQGVDWSVAQFRLGSLAHVGGSFSNVVTGADAVSGTGTNTGSITEIGGIALPGESFRTVIGSGKVDLLIKALTDQGNVTVEDRSTASALNNQMALIQVSEDRPLFKRTAAFTTQNVGTGTVTPGSQTLENFQQEDVSFGNILEVIPQIDDNLVTTLSVAPSLTDFRGTVTSPDGKSTAFNRGVKRYRSTIVMRNGETAIIGGFIQITDGTASRGVPGLSKIPVLGQAFRTDAKALMKSELVLMITVEAADPVLAKPERVETPTPNQTQQSASAAAPVAASAASPATGRVELVGSNSK